MKKHLLSFISLLPFLAFSQNKSYVSINPLYIRNIDAADEFFEDSLYREAVAFYLKALEITEVAFRSKYRLATCYLKIGEFASASAWLEKCAELNPKDLSELVLDEDSELYKYRPFLNWYPLQKAAVAALPSYNFQLKKQLEEIEHFDQFIRTEHRLPNETDCAGNPYYWPGMTWPQVDSVNEIRVAAIIEQVGDYPGPEMVGDQRHTVWLVIQHAPLEFQDRYFPLVERATDEGKIGLGDWAYLVDRRNMNRGIKQIYGSQMQLKEDKITYEIYPLEDPFHLNERRAAVGLVPIEQYIEHWGIKFEPEKMQDRTP
jgi:tetratricopeptide (TPR) repeat protein